MNECATYIPALHGVSSNHSIYLHWMIPTSFITVDPELSLCWVNHNKESAELDWLLKYQYMNKESYLGYFNDGGFPVINFDDGLSEPHITTLKTKGVAEKDIIQITRPHNFIKKDRRSGTLVAIEIRPQPSSEEVRFIGAEIKFKEHPRVIEPRGRKRTYKRSRWEDYDDYYYSSEFKEKGE